MIAKRNMLHPRHVPALCVAALLSSVGTTAQGQSVFAVDEASSPNRLVTVDVMSGQVTPVGPLTGVPSGTVADLEFLGCRLFGVVLRYPDSADLVEINSATGAVLWARRMILGGLPLINAVEGLGTINNRQLVVAFWRSGAPDQTASDTLGYLEEDGTVTIAATGLGTDFDGVCTGLGQELFAIDRVPRTGNVELSRVTASPPQRDFVRTFSFSQVDGVGDLAVVSNQIVSIDFAKHAVHRFDVLSGALIASVPHSAGYSMSSLAYQRVVADLNQDGLVDFGDYLEFLNLFEAGDPRVDFNHDGLVDFSDYLEFLNHYDAGC